MLKTVFILSLLHISLLYAADADKCIHFLNRTSFGVDYKQLSTCLHSQNYEMYVKQIVYGTRSKRDEVIPTGSETLLLPPPKGAKNYMKKRKNFTKKSKVFEENLKVWWLNKMVETDQPFLERMVLFWHSHFTTSIKKVRQSSLMYRQNVLFRKYALGNFGTLLHQMIEDPAMLFYLDNRINRKQHPNENFARELLELYTMGEGHYTEQDVQSLAKALTGYSINKEREFLFKKHIHDRSIKVLFGEKGNFDGHQAVSIVLRQKETATFIVRKLWHTFIGEKVQEKELERLVQLFRKHNYELKPLLYAMFTSSSFTDPAVRGTMIKSPVELIVGALRTFEYDNFDPKTRLKYTKILRQNLFTPPNVRGWREGKFWINVNSLLHRKAFINLLLRGDMMKNFKFELFRLAPQNISTEAFIVKALLPDDGPIAPADTLENRLRTILDHPRYQLK